jgi:hypothetical protein
MSFRNFLFYAAALYACVVFSANAQTTITGTVKSSTTGGALAGATVSLKVLGTTSQTDVNGKFTLTIATSVLPRANASASIRTTMVGSTLFFEVMRFNDKVSVDIFDLSGSHGTSLLNTTLPAGRYDLDGLSQNLSPGIYFVRMSVGNNTSSFSLPVINRSAPGSVRLNKTNAASVPLTKQLSVIDSLVAQKTGYVRSATPISQYSGAYTLVMDSVNGSSSNDVVGKVTVGYQGWFSCSGDGSPKNNFGHMNLEMWPDARDYATTFSYDGTLGNGQPAKMFSDWTQSTMNTHFLWMQQNGIDCVALQRFGTELDNGTEKAWKDGISTHMIAAATTYGRKFYIMYDISGWGSFQTEIKSDWTNTIVGSLKLTASSAYAKQGGKPVVCIWGFGVSGEPGNATSWSDVITWFKSQGCYVIGGTAGGFATDATNSAAYNDCDMLMPWPVGARGNLANFQSSYTRDLAYCKAHQIDYQAGVYPGTAFYNTNGSGKNLIPRMHGDFMWSQFAAARNAGVQSVYIAMFDEMNEATSIFKCAEDSTMIPKGKYFLTLDVDGVHVSSDFYLRLVNNGGMMVKGLIPYQATHTTPFVQ